MTINVDEKLYKTFKQHLLSNKTIILEIDNAYKKDDRFMLNDKLSCYVISCDSSKIEIGAI